MKRIACLLVMVALAGTGCVNMQSADTMPQLPPPPAEPAAPPVLAAQVNDGNAADVAQSLNDELDRSANESSTTPEPAPPH
jgi:hypothetical protein